MKSITSGWFALLILLALALSAAGPASPTVKMQKFQFDIGSTYGDRNKFDFRVTKAGCILGQIKSWSRSGNTGPAAQELDLILNGSDRTGYYARNDGSRSSVSPLWVSYAVSSSEVGQVKTWTISVINFTGRGSATGSINVEFPPTQVPCELKAAVSRTRGRIDLSWRHTGKFFRGAFLVERSTNGANWRVVRACTKKPSSRQTSYSCSDTGLTSGGVYYYRACAVTTGSRCGRTNLTPAITVRAP